MEPGQFRRTELDFMFGRALSVNSFRGVRLPLIGVALVVLASCGTIEEQCSSRHGASGPAYDQCIERQLQAIRLMHEDQRRARQSIPDFN